MEKKLVIVESPTKARTISRFLGKDFIVESSYGHIRDLPRSKLGVDVEHNFDPQYLIPRDKNSVVKKLREAAKKADTIILAADEDREGEAIAWHLIKALGLDEIKSRPSSRVQIKGKSKIKKVERIVFHEITKHAIEEALKNPRDIDMKRVDAQQARRILDRLVGYKLSPFLWKKVYRGLSAGRVQSVAVRLIVEREREIQEFKPQEYHTISALLRKLEFPISNSQNSPPRQIPGLRPSDAKTFASDLNEFEANLAKIGEKTLDKFDIKTAEEAEKIVKTLKDAAWTIENVEKRATSKNPLPPFTTSTLQQEAFRHMGFSAKQTMRLAQQLYEGVELGEEGATGLITYMRTDSVNLSEESLKTASEFLQKEVGENYALPSPRRFQTKTKGAQEAHEAIRPTDPWRTPESIKHFLDAQQFKLYNLVWRRFVATQMPTAIFESTAVEVAATTNYQLPTTNYTFRATGQVMKFDGFLKIYPTKFTEVTLPELVVKEELELAELKPQQHFTQSPPRYTEASLVKTLEKNGIGRPSTYAPTISTVQDRGYVERFERRYLKPTEVGFIVNDMLVEHFPEVVDVEFTVKMEEELDEIATGTKGWQPVIREFYEPFSKHLEAKYEEVEKHEVQETTDKVCEKCGKPMVVKMGRFGKFIACSGFPDCKNTKTIKVEPQTIDMKCPKCSEGDVVIRRTRRRKIFYGCSRYPDCDYASWTDPRKEDKTVK
ncbi:MAG: DNA topoisomerase I [Candidatus Sungbacteria bacterium RIFCSPHIGHO2_02_FULL_47_11]|uniref:DNA topoisomerase 1 n=1 Tax=Candidatus Sungbacteria bacterium RIFCSPHIGHO2_02_FULL_47_11 TaxID=1802270 RepID=A0A1G2KGC5_9BACT|nr:MAG: DNA topoisomerase I [Candidatus Sungbacteria bacterium RIFCSPHIGHO2_02_FULL_47_11]